MFMMCSVFHALRRGNTWAADAHDARQGWPCPQAAATLGRLMLMMLGAVLAVPSNSFNTEAADAHDARCRVCSAAALGAADAYDVRCNVFHALRHGNLGQLTLMMVGKVGHTLRQLQHRGG